MDKSLVKKPIREWVGYCITKNLDVPEWMKQIVRKNYMQKYTFCTAFNDMVRLKTTIMDPVNHTCTVFSAHSENVSVNYGFLYSVDSKHYNMIYNDKYKKRVMDRYCVAPSLTSVDGEYRTPLLYVRTYEVLRVRYRVEYEFLERYMLHKMEKYRISLESENFFPQIQHDKFSEEIDMIVHEYEFTRIFFIMFWFGEVYKISLDINENHINPKFNQIFFADLNDDLDQLKTLCKKFGKERITEMYKDMRGDILLQTRNKVIDYAPTSYKIGQKLRPLNVGEVQQPLNILHSPWLEIYLSQYTSRLLVNGVCASFPVFINWYYIKNTKKGMFDNEHQYKKIENSDAALHLTKKLREAQRITYSRGVGTKKFINDMFKDIYDQVEHPIEFAKSHLVMSNVTLGFAIQDVGSTFGDLDRLNRAKAWVDVVGDIRDNNVFRKYVWDICYALLCMNVKLGMTHSDLHLNNCTIYNGNHTDTPAHAVYKVFDYYFAIPSRGIYAYIIDMSRGTIHPKIVEKYPHFDNSDEYLQFVDRQNRSMIHKLHVLLPTFMKINVLAVTQLQRDHFDVFYKLYSAVDTLEYSSKLLMHLKELSPASKTLLGKISRISQHYLTTVMLKVINNSDLIVDWPIFAVLKECYADDIIPEEESAYNIIDIWVLDNPIKYSLDTAKEWPPYMQQKYKMTADVKKPELVPTDTMDVIHNVEKYVKSQMAMVYYIAKRHVDKYY